MADYIEAVTQNIKSFVGRHMGGIRSLVERYHPKPNYWIMARDLIRARGTVKRQREFTQRDFCHELGISEATVSTGATYRKINEIFKMNWMELKRFILTNELPDRLRDRQNEFYGYID